MNKMKQSKHYIPGRKYVEIMFLFIGDLIGFIYSIGIVNIIRYFLLSTDATTLFDVNVIRTISYMITMTICIFIGTGLYPGRGQTSVVELKKIAYSIFISNAIVSVIIIIEGNITIFSRSIFLLSGILASIFIPIMRFLMRREISRHAWWGEPVAVIGYYNQIIEISKKMLSCPRLGYRPVIGLSVDGLISDENTLVPIRCWSLQEQKAIHDSQIVTNVLAISTSELLKNYPEIFHSVGLSFKKTIFILDRDIFGIMMSEPIDMNGYPAIISKQSLDDPYRQLIKTIFEYMLVILLIVPISLFSLFIAIIIKLDSPGPIFYNEERIGRHGKPFKVFKFRSMFVNSDEILDDMLKHPEISIEWKKYHKIKNDYRITKTGKLIRRFSIDELPQFINVLRGEMNLIGPRPLVLSEIYQLGKISDFVLKVKPGLTGWWQVMGRNKLTFEERKNLDLYYIYNWSIWVDLFIFMKTFWVIIASK